MHIQNFGTFLKALLQVLSGAMLACCATHDEIDVRLRCSTAFLPSLPTYTYLTMRAQIHETNPASHCVVNVYVGLGLKRM